LWFKISQSFNTFINDFPGCFGFKTVGVNYYRYDLNTEDFTNPIMVYAETRPLKLSGADYKKIHRLLLGGYLNIVPSLFGLYMAGTIDDNTWRQLNNSGYFNSKGRMVIGRSQYSCRYFILAFGGAVDEDTYFNHIAVDQEERYMNKLR